MKNPLSNFLNFLFDRSPGNSPGSVAAHIHACLTAPTSGCCLLCSAHTLATQNFCSGCRTDLPWLPATRCLRCAHPLPAAGICGRCLADPPYYDAVIASCRYDFPVSGLIQAYKYGGRLAIGSALAGLWPVHQLPHPDRIIPMPLAAQRLRERGFNQALELARVLGRTLGAPVDALSCVKTRETPPQTRLPWKERRKNIRGAFVVQENLQGAHVLVVDDVLTTGATLHELARSLKRAGAATVTGCVVARTVASG